MLDVEERLRDELEPIAPLRDDDRDWGDVVARTRPPRPRGGRRLAALTLAVLLLAAGTAIAVARLTGRTYVPFATSRTAPNVVKKRFADLEIGAPPTMASGIRAAQAREVGTVSIGGRARKLWVAPTRRGGYCFEIENGFGGCRFDASERRAAPVAASWRVEGPSGRPVVAQIGGDLTDAKGYRLTVEYVDGTSHDIPFVWVSKPIAAGFFAYDVPAAHKRYAARVARLVLFSRSGARLNVERVPPSPVGRIAPRPHVHSQPAGPRALATKPPEPLKPPTEHGAADGVTVEAGANGVAVFDLSGLDATRRALLARGASYACFRLTREFGIPDVRGMGISGRMQPRVAAGFWGVGTPFDGCDVEGHAGQRWPLRFGGHSVAEVPFTPSGRAFFADRAAARDVAHFARSTRAHGLRDLTGETLVRALEKTYGAQLATSAIRVRATADGAMFSERSASGKTFLVVVRDGRIVRQNVKHYAYVR